MSARPRASICRSPPESWWPGAGRGAAERLEEVVDLADRAHPVRARRYRHSAPSRRFSSTVSSATTLRPSGTWARPRRTRSSTRYAREVTAVEQHAARSRGTSAPAIVRSSVVLPAPLAPRSATIAPSGEAAGSRRAARARPPYADGQAVDLEDDAHDAAFTPRYASSTRGSARTSSGVPLGDHAGRSRARRCGRPDPSRSRRGARRAARRSRRPRPTRITPPSCGDVVGAESAGGLVEQQQRAAR